jgi:hypothetical protein
MSVRAYKTDYDEQGIEVKLGGDAELQTIIQALEFIVKTLKEGAKEQS